MHDHKQPISYFPSLGAIPPNFLSSSFSHLDSCIPTSIASPYSVRCLCFCLHISTLNPLTDSSKMPFQILAGLSFVLDNVIMRKSVALHFALQSTATHLLSFLLFLRSHTPRQIWAVSLSSVLMHFVKMFFEPGFMTGIGGYIIASPSGQSCKISL
jgi:hypothetical protein